MNNLIKQAKLELARREFFFYCQLMADDFYKEERKYLVELCNDLQSFINDDGHNVLIMNMPPRHGKSRTAQLFVQWLLGNNPREKIMTGSYNETLSTMFAKGVRNAIQEQKADEEIIVYSDIFPNVAIKHGDATMSLWSLEGQNNSYLATSPSGTATGFGCSLMIIDDIVKNSEEAYGELTKEKHWDWFTNTMLSRLEEGGKIILIMTRWASDDLAGKAIQHFSDDPNFKVKVITMKALQDDGSMLCDDVLSFPSYQSKVRAMGEDIASANYQQIPIDIKGKLYAEIKTYDTAPIDKFTEIKYYCDTADTGSDYLCGIAYGVYEGIAYVLDVAYTQEPMEVTESLVANSIVSNNVKVADIESNNGGRGFGRNVQRLIGNYKCSFNLFHQSKNKQARILSQSTNVMNYVVMPSNWRDKWGDFYEAVNKYQRIGKNAHDDCADALTGVVEKMETDNRFGW